MILLKQNLLNAGSRGYCTDRNKKKQVDPDLIEDIVNEIVAEIARITEVSLVDVAVK